MKILATLEKMRLSGISLTVDDGRIIGRPSHLITDKQRAFIRENKEEIRHILSETTKNERQKRTEKHLADDPYFAQLRKTGYLVYPDGEAAEHRMYYSTTVLLMRDGDAWELVRARWAKDTPMAVEERRIWRGESTTEAVNRAISYLQWSRSKAGGRT